MITTVRLVNTAINSHKHEVLIKNRQHWEFPGGLVVRIPGFHCHGPGSVPGWATLISSMISQDSKWDMTGRSMRQSSVELVILGSIRGDG